MQLDIMVSDFVMVDDAGPEDVSTDRCAQRSAVALSTRGIAAFADKTVAPMEKHDMAAKQDDVLNSLTLEDSALDNSSYHELHEDSSSDELELLDTTDNVYFERDLLNLHAWREETDTDLHFISDWEGFQARVKEFNDQKKQSMDSKASVERERVMIRFNQFLAVHDCNTYTHDPAISFKDDFDKCAMTYAWLPGTEAHDVFRTRALAAEEQGETNEGELQEVLQKIE